MLLLLVGQVKAAGATPPSRLYPHGEDTSDTEVVCRRSNWGVSRPVAFPKVKLFDNIYTNVLVIYTHGYVALSQRLNRRTPADIRKAMTAIVKQRSRRYGFGILAPLWTDNDCSHGKTFYHVYDSTKTTSDPVEKARMEAIMELAKDDVIKYSGELDFVPTWVLVVTWRNMLPRLNYDAVLDKVYI
ncbi:hypothetical protein LSAT2_019006 [Lamellibrachia satsuma]|nr:hypothetical protein LSAT2_019006 [Lamellibrachia satsuma]